MSKSGRSENLQIMRAVAALLVVWAHAIDVAETSGGKPSLALGNFENFGAFGVDIFFVISGYIISASSQAGGRNWLTFAKDRFFRVAPIFYLISIPWILASIRWGTFDANKLVPNFLFWPIIGGKFYEPFLTVGWTLSFEMLFYCAMTGAMFVRSYPSRPPVVVAGLFIALMLAKLIMGTATMMFVGNPIVLEFLFGIAIWYASSLRLNLKPAAYALLFVALLTLSYELIYGFGDLSESNFTQDATLSFSRSLWWGLPAAAIILFAISVRNASTSNPLVRLLVFFGDASYSIYLIHLFVMFLCGFAIRRSWIAGNEVVLLGFVGSIVAGSMSYLLLERPIAAVVRRRRENAPSAAATAI